MLAQNQENSPCYLAFKVKVYSTAQHIPYRIVSFAIGQPLSPQNERNIFNIPLRKLERRFKAHIREKVRVFKSLLVYCLSRRRRYPLWEIKINCQFTNKRFILLVLFEPVNTILSSWHGIIFRLSLPSLPLLQPKIPLRLLTFRALMCLPNDTNISIVFFKIKKHIR